MHNYKLFEKYFKDVKKKIKILRLFKQKALVSLYLFKK